MKRNTINDDIRDNNSKIYHQETFGILTPSKSPRSPYRSCATQFLTFFFRIGPEINNIWFLCNTSL